MTVIGADAPVSGARGGVGLCAHQRGDLVHLHLPQCRVCALLDPQVLTCGLTHLRVDLAAGTWERKYDSLLELEVLDVGWRRIVTDE